VNPFRCFDVGSFAGWLIFPDFSFERWNWSLRFFFDYPLILFIQLIKLFSGGGSSPSRSSASSYLF